MIAKEWRDARWKAAVAVLVMLSLAPVLVPYSTSLESAKRINGYHVDSVTLGSEERPPSKSLEDAPAPEGMAGGFGTVEPVDTAMLRVVDPYLAGGFYIILPFAALLGAGLISSEVGNSTMSLLLARPVSRTRMLLAKYGVCAGVVLMTILFGGIFLLAVALVRDYPLARLDAARYTLTGVSICLAALFVLGVALLASAVCRTTIFSLTVTVAAVFLVLGYGVVLPEILRYAGYAFATAYEISDRLWLPYYWLGLSGYSDSGLGVTSSLVCPVAAAIPLLAALWLFRRTSY